MLIKDVLDLLNNGESISNIALKLGKNEELIRKKLHNAAIEFNEEASSWTYSGNYSEVSLNRNILKKIVVLKEDKPFLIKSVDKKEGRDTTSELELELIKAYIEVDHSQLTNKKSFFLNDDVYEKLKAISIEKSLKINVLLHALLCKGMDFYNL